MCGTDNIEKRGRIYLDIRIDSNILKIYGNLQYPIILFSLKCEITNHVANICWRETNSMNEQTGFHLKEHLSANDVLLSIETVSHKF